MIVDVHTHTPTHRQPLPASRQVINTKWRTDRPVVASTGWADYERAAQGASVSIVFNIAVADPLAATGIPADPARTNDATAEFVAAAPERRIGFLSINPSSDDAIDELERCVTQLGLRGIKLGPNYQNFNPLGRSARRIYDIAEKRGLPILFHAGTSPVRGAPLRYAHPLVFDEIASEFPELKFVIAHMGHPWTADTAVVIRKHPHVYADTSTLFLRPWGLYQALLAAQEWGVLAKLLFASDFPVASVGEAIAGLRGANRVVAGTGLPVIASDAIEEIIERDALSLLGLGSPRSARDGS
jgi:hypothetical protein